MLNCEEGKLSSKHLDLIMFMLIISEYVSSLEVFQESLEDGHVSSLVHLTLRLYTLKTNETTFCFSICSSSTLLVNLLHHLLSVFHVLGTMLGSGRLQRNMRSIL